MSNISFCHNAFKSCFHQINQNASASWERCWIIKNVDLIIQGIQTLCQLIKRQAFYLWVTIAVQTNGNRITTIRCFEFFVIREDENILVTLESVISCSPQVTGLAMMLSFSISRSKCSLWSENIPSLLHDKSGKKSHQKVDTNSQIVFKTFTPYDI